MKKPFPAYDGDDPYVFVSYAHEDADAVFVEMSWLHDQGFNVWYDEGISPGAVWRSELAEAINGAGLFLFFVTPRSAHSENCEKEVNYAVDHGMPVLAVHLERTELPSGLDLTLSSIQGIMKHELPERQYREKLLAATSDHLRRGISVAAPAASPGNRNFVIGAGIVIAALIGAYWVKQSPGTGAGDLELPAEVAVRRLTVELPHSMRASMNEYRPVKISPDGQRLIFSAVFDGQESLYARPMNSLDAMQIPGSESTGRTIALSPDGAWVAFQDRRDGTLRKIPAAGGIPATICDPGGLIQSISWGRSGDLVFDVPGHNGLMRVAAAGGQPEQLTSPPEGEIHKQPAFLHGGQGLLFTIGERGSTMRRSDRIAVLSLSNGEQKSLMAGASPSSTPSGQLLYYSENALRAVAFDADRLQVTSESVAVAERVHYIGDAHYSVSAEGTLVYVLRTELVNRSLVWVDRHGNEEIVPLDRRPYRDPRLSPDGRRIAAVVNSENGADLWVYSLDRGTSTRLTFDEAREASPLWSPDGTTIFFSSNRVDDLFRVPSDGTGSIEQLTDTDTYQFASTLTSNGRLLLTDTEALGGQATIRALALADGTSSVVLASSYHPQLSPNGRWMAYHSNRSGESQVYVRPFPDTDSAVWQISTGVGFHALWSLDGGELFYIGPAGMMSVKVSMEPEFEASRPEALFTTEPYVFRGARNMDLDRTNERFLMVKKPSEYELPTNRIVVVENWLAEVAPTLRDTVER